MLLEAMDFVGKLPEEDLLAEVFAEHAAWRGGGGRARRRPRSLPEKEARETADKAKCSRGRVHGTGAREGRTVPSPNAPRLCNTRRCAAGATAMAAALLGARGGGRQRRVEAAPQRPAADQLEALGQQAGQAAAIKQQQLMAQGRGDRRRRRGHGERG